MFKGTRSETCSTCLCPDDEEHRLNECSVYSHTNYHDCPTKVKFETLFSDNVETVREILTRIETVWNTHTGQCHLSVL